MDKLISGLLGAGLSRPDLEEATRRYAGGVFSDQEIFAAIETGQIIIDPLDPVRVQNSSVDVCLGEHFFKMERNPDQNLLNPFDPESRRQYFKPISAHTHLEWLEIENIRTPFTNIPLDKRMFLIRPNERILAHTLENIGIAWGGTSMMHAKSSIGRYGVSVCDDAGWGDQGYIGRWTMEIKNKNEHASVPLVVGMPIAQLIFFKMTASLQRYGSIGHYQTGTDPAVVKANWQASNMLPRIFDLSDLSEEVQ